MTGPVDPVAELRRQQRLAHRGPDSLALERHARRAELEASVALHHAAIARLKAEVVGWVRAGMPAPRTPKPPVARGARLRSSPPPPSGSNRTGR